MAEPEPTFLPSCSPASLNSHIVLHRAQRTVGAQDMVVTVKQSLWEASLLEIGVIILAHLFSRTGSWFLVGWILVQITHSSSE